MKLARSLVSLAAAAAAGASSAAVIQLDFEGVGNLAAVNSFYNGGTDSQGHSGVNHGVSFSGATLGLIDGDAGGSGNFGNEPSPNTVMFFLDANNAILNFAAGFDTGFSFFYSSSTAASVNVYDGLDGTGTLLGTLDLAAVGIGSCGDPTGDFCIWTPIGVAFGGTARSIDFGGTANFTGFDNITFGSDTPVVSIPEPSTHALMALGLLGVAARTRRRSEERA